MPGRLAEQIHVVANASLLFHHHGFARLRLKTASSACARLAMRTSLLLLPQLFPFDRNPPRLQPLPRAYLFHLPGVFHPGAVPGVFPLQSFLSLRASHRQLPRVVFLADPARTFRPAFLSVALPFFPLAKKNLHWLPDFRPHLRRNFPQVPSCRVVSLPKQFHLNQTFVRPSPAQFLALRHGQRRLLPQVSRMSALRPTEFLTFRPNFLREAHEKSLARRLHNRAPAHRRRPQ